MYVSSSISKMRVISTEICDGDISVNRCCSAMSAWRTCSFDLIALPDGSGFTGGAVAGNSVFLGLRGGKGEAIKDE